MKLTHELTLDMKRSDDTQKLEMKQGDAFTRAVKLNLTEDGAPWQVPADVSVVVRYSRGDGTSGIYDTMPDGGKAWKISGNAVTVELVPAMLALSGPVWVDLALICGESVLSTFRFWIQVTAGAADGTQAEQQSYYKVATLEKINAWMQGLEDGKLNRTGDTLTGDFNAGGYRITGLPWPENWSDAVPREYVDEKLSQTAPGEGAAQPSLPDYWTDYLHNRIAEIRRLQEAAGKDGVCFLVLTDLVPEKNLGGRSPVLAAKILEECQIPYMLLLGSVRENGAAQSREEARRELDAVNEMLLPLKGRLLQTQGQYDGGFGLGDYNGSGEAEENAYELTAGELFERIYRKNGRTGQVHWDESGTAMYVDDWTSRARFLLLNAHCNPGYTNAEGTAKYPSAYFSRFTQSQFDFAIQAIQTMPGEDWGLVVGCHMPLNKTGEMPDGDLMGYVLAAYRNKTTVSGEFEGYGDVGPEFTSAIQEDGEGYTTGMRYRSGTVAMETNASYFTSNLIPCKVKRLEPDLLRVTGLSFAQLLLCTVTLLDESKTVISTAKTVSEIQNDWTEERDNSGVGTGVWTWDIGSLDRDVREETFRNAKYLQISLPASCQNSVIATVNEPISYATEPYDRVQVEADFSNAKGKMLCCFCGHVQKDTCWDMNGVPLVATRSDAAIDAYEEMLAQRVKDTVTEQSFDVVIVNRKKGKLTCIKIGAGYDREYQI